MLGTTIGGRYKIIRTLGGGGFGETFVAEDLQLPDRMQCAVKRLKPQTNDPFVLQTARRLFETEAIVLHRLGKHPQIPQLLAHFEENQEFYLVQELIEGHSLDAELNQPMPEPQVIALLMDILSVLEFVHQQNAIHRDLKPANLIRRNSDGKLVLIDFGAVKQIPNQLTSTVNPTNVTVAIGTPGYMPSEQSSGKPRPCSDIYALGIIAIQALTGKLPAQLPEDPATGEIVWHGLAPVSSALAAIIDLMVRYDFRTRYQTSTEVIAALKHLNQPIASTAVSTPPHLLTYPHPNSGRTDGFGQATEVTPTVAVGSDRASNNIANFAQNRAQAQFPWKVGLGVASVLAIAIAIPTILLNRPTTQFNQSNLPASTPNSQPPIPNSPTPTPTPQSSQTPTPISTDPQPTSPPIPNPQSPSLPNYETISSQPLSAADLDGLSEIELDVIRNEVFARHGRRFKDAELQAYFNNQVWYRPIYDPDRFPDYLLGEIEKQNVQFIADYQKNLAQHQAQNPCYTASVRANRDPISVLNVRSGAGTQFAIAGKLEYGTILQVVGERDGWLQISSPIQGWVAKSRTGCPG
ncbi:protein kinase domain-containing protein [Pseudanabaena sp. PCC 6802]|uniref:protein kinase domain-containing protein n=1 Tax=Pseudanabaena sp. PCC 6802 TaxID=118173 RepID=UPI0003448F87|nr:YARHG domain-containing protein [Pseudanabaena sp. PCC 6802]